MPPSLAGAPPPSKVAGADAQGLRIKVHAALSASLRELVAAVSQHSQAHAQAEHSGGDARERVRARRRYTKRSQCAAARFSADIGTRKPAQRGVRRESGGELAAMQDDANHAVKG